MPPPPKKKREKYCIPANQSDFVVFVPIFSSKKGEKSEQYDFYVGRRRKKN